MFPENLFCTLISPRLDYGDVIYDQPHNDVFCRSIESVQYNAAIKGSSRDRIYQELGLESLREGDGPEDLFIF